MMRKYVLPIGALVVLALPATATAQVTMTSGRVKERTFAMLRHHGALEDAYDNGQVSGPRFIRCGQVGRLAAWCAFRLSVRNANHDSYSGISECRFYRRGGRVRQSCRVYVSPSASSTTATATDLSGYEQMTSGRVKREAFVMLRRHGWLEIPYNFGHVRGPIFTGCRREAHRLRPAVECSFYLLLKNVLPGGYDDGYVHAYDGAASCRYFYRDDGTRQADGSLPVWRSCRVRMAPASAD